MEDFERPRQLQHIIIDFGSNTIKCGFNFEPFPRLIVPNVIGKIKEKSFSPIKDYNEYFCGFDALYNSSSIDVSYPRIENKGKFLTNEEGQKALESLFSYILDQKLKVHDLPIFIVDSIFTSSKERETIAQILFEKFNIFQLHFEPQSIMTLYSTSKTSGLVVQSGEMTTEIVPIIEGFIISQGICNFPISGHEITKRFENAYKDIFDINNVSNQYWMAQKIKEKFSEILPSNQAFEELMSKKENKNEYVLPDGNIVELGNEIFEIPESIFNPNIIEVQSDNLPNIILDSINRCDISTRKELFNNIILGGGNTLIKGFETRLKSEINAIKKRNCGIVSLKERNYSAWIGSSGISSLSIFSSRISSNNKWISKTDYSKYGESLFENDYLFNYSVLSEDKSKKFVNEGMESAGIYKKYIMGEQI